MGILSDFLVATSSDASLYASGPEAQLEKTLLSRISLAQYKHFTPVSLGSLWAILANEEWDVVRHEFIDESKPGEEESWLLRFPEPFVTFLTNASDQELASANAAWAATEELVCTPDELMPVTVDLQRLAREARTTGRALYLWGSL